MYRNIRASSMTGVVNDYVNRSIDPTNVEALVGSSTFDQAIFSKFVMLEDGDNSNTRIPTIFGRDQSGQCAAFQAQDYLSPALNPTSPFYELRKLIKLPQLPEGEYCE